MRGPGQLGSIAAKANERVSVRAPPEAPAKNAGQREELQGEEGRPQPCPDRPGRPAGQAGQAGELPSCPWGTKGV